MSKIKKILALWIAIIMLLGLVPTMAFAAPPNPGPPASERPWQQHPVVESYIVVAPNSGGTSYNLNIMWTRPPLSRVINHSFPVGRLQEAVDGGLWTIFPTHYIVNTRNATANRIPSVQTFSVDAPAGGQVRDADRPVGQRLEVSTQRDFTMQPSSLYEITIEPIRPVPYELPPVPPATIGVLSSRDATIANAPGLPIGRDLLFLTDIAPVEAIGRGRAIEVTWPNPTFGTTNIFPYWQLSYRIHQPEVAPPAWLPLTPLSVGPGEGQIRQNDDGTLTATIYGVGDGFRLVGSYEVRVEPMLGPHPGNENHRVRQGRTYARIDSIPGRHFNLHFTQNEYTSVVTMVPELTVDQTGVEFIRLSWGDLTQIRPRIRQLVIEEWPGEPQWEGVVPDSEAGRIGIIQVLGGQGRDNTSALIGPGIPREARGFSLAIHLENPDEVVRTPIVIFDPLRAEFGPYSPEIIELFHAGVAPDGGTLGLGMEWLAFARFPAVPAEADSIPPGDPYNGRFVDLNLYYEIFVTDSWANMTAMTRPTRVAAPLMTIGLPGPEVERGRQRSPVPHYPYMYDPTWLLRDGFFIRQFQTLTPAGAVINDIEGNRVYFVGIRAVRYPGGQVSTWAFGSVYVPPLRPLDITPEMIPAPPVQITREGIDEIDLEWDIRYLEIMRPATPQAIGMTSPPERNLWYTVVGVDRDARNNNLIFGRSATHINYLLGDPAAPGSPARHRFLNDMIRPSSLRDRLLGLQDPLIQLNVNDPMQVAEFLRDANTEVEDFMVSQWGLPRPPVPPITLRIQDTHIFNPQTREMIPFSYQIHAVPYATVRQFSGGFEAYRTHLNNSPDMWRSIGQPPITNGVARHTVTGLTENTPYVIFIRPYVTIGGRLIPAAHPTFVIGTTGAVIVRPIPDPTTPVLHEVPRYTRRDRVGVRWRVQSDMIYEIRISHFFSDYPNGGTVIPLSFENVSDAIAGDTVTLENPRAILNVQDVGGTPYFHLQIFERFPDTQYYIWARAIGVDANGNVATTPSQPSNPVDIRTLDIEPPPPPRSFGRAPQNLLNTFNRYNDTEYQSDEPYALTLSWMRILADLRDDDGSLRERAETGAGDGNVRPLNLPNISVTEAYAALHLLRFEELRANQRFYARARTFLTVQRNQPDLYSYEIQLADNDEFLDAITFIIPPLPDLDPINMRRAYSTWVYLEVDTGVSPDEFDGVHRPDQYPLPERDWEITYDRATQTLTWRFRTNQRGADGRLDQNVDQRFITRLIHERVFTFTIDLSAYGAMPIANREVIVPESILRAFNERQITLEILAGEHNIQIPPGAFDTAQTRGLQPGIGSYYTIALTAQLSGMPPLTTNTEFATVPQRLEVGLATPTRLASLTTFARPINIDLPVGDHITPDSLRTGLFIVDRNTASWRDTQGQFNFATEMLRSTIQTPTTFAGIARNAPPTEAPQDRANAPMQRVTAALNITDMTRFNPAQEVTANEFNNLVNAVAQNQTTVTMNATMSAADRQSMTRARLLAAPDFTRETALDILVRLYEARTRQILTPMTPAESIPGMQNAAPELLRTLRIAADLGFITGPLQPDGVLTMGEFMHILDIIIEDAR